MADLKKEFSQNKFEEAVDSAMNLYPRIDGYKIEGTYVQVFYPSNSGRTERVAEYNFNDGGIITGNYKMRQDIPYAGDRHALDLGDTIREHLFCPEEYEGLGLEFGKLRLDSPIKKQKYIDASNVDDSFDEELNFPMVVKVIDIVQEIGLFDSLYGFWKNGRVARMIRKERRKKRLADVKKDKDATRLNKGYIKIGIDS